MHIVLSFFSTRPVEGLERNHAGYAQAHGYEHVVVDGTGVFGERQGVLHRYHAIYQQLLRLPDGDQGQVERQDHCIQKYPQKYPHVLSPS